LELLRSTDMTPFEKAYAEARRKWTRGEGGPTFSFNGKPYSVATREEAARRTYQPLMGADKKGGKSASTPGKTEPLMYTSRAQGGKFRKSEGK
jgi:hypothetical protein